MLLPENMATLKSVTYYLKKKRSLDSDLANKLKLLYQLSAMAIAS